MTTSIRRYELPVGAPVAFDLGGNPLRVEARPDDPGTVEFWAEYHTGVSGFRRTFQVFGTGQPIPEGAQWFGTASRTPEGLVWHLFELRGDR